jgi:glycosyltransferase involved in cell wall biosynthesis
MRKIKILHITLDFGPGGVERFIVDLFKWYDKSQFDMAAISLYSRQNDGFEKDIDEMGAKVYYLNKIKSFDIRMIYRIIRIVEDYEPDVIQAHVFTTRYALYPAWKKGIPIRIHTAHLPAGEESKGFIWRVLQRVAYRKGGFVPVAVSEYEKDTICSAYTLDDVPVIYNGVDLNVFSYIPRRESSVVSIINVSRFVPAKNHNMLIDGFLKAMQENTQLRMTLVGDGPLKSSIEKKVAKLRVAQMISFTGAISDVASELNRNDIFVLTSEFEAFGLVLIEAMACGLPVIATRVGAVPEIIEDGVNGILVEKGDVCGLSRAIVALASNREWRQRMRAANLEAVKKFNIHNVVRSYENLYLTLFERSDTELTHAKLK